MVYESENELVGRSRHVDPQGRIRLTAGVGALSPRVSKNIVSDWSAGAKKLGGPPLRLLYIFQRDGPNAVT